MATTSSITTKDYTEIVLIRHGETDWNITNKIQGQLDIELNEFGKEQASAVANRLSKEPKFSAIYSSDLKRALETAQTITNSCGKLEVVQDKDLRERHFGDLQGYVLDQSAKRSNASKLKPEAYKAYKTGNVIPGGGETVDQFHKRCIAAVQKIGEKHKGERVVVVTHGGVIKELQKKTEAKKKRWESVENASVSVIQLAGDGEWVIQLWDDARHLEDLGAAEGFEF
ncbi:phosphoglycerate mutase (2,3-diphosphoglycerate-independent) [Ranunculus cassubicifolius]